MKILGIGLNNLASLAGEYHIDFTVEPLANAGLFAITGPTGSGKSTVLDAVCLALYGTTPRLREAGSGIRLEDISGKPLTAQDPRHLLRRGCDRGHAYVTFRGLDGVHYRAEWQIRRARARLGVPGQLRIDRQLLTADDGKVLNTNPSELDSLVPEKVGLTFDQFTRAVLLAQSEFSAFLKASENDRGELLEKLTNTQVYSEIGIAAYRHTSQARKELEHLQALAGGVESLPPEDRKALEKDAQATEKRFAALEADRNTLDQHLRWHRDLEKLETGLKAAEQERRAARQQWEELAPERDILHWLGELLPQRHLFKERRELKDAAPERERQLTDHRRQREQAQAQLAARQAGGEQASAGLMQADQTLREARPALQQAHTLDHGRMRLRQAVEDARRQLQEQSRTLKELETRIHAEDEASAAAEKSLTQIQTRLERRTAPDGPALAGSGQSDDSEDTPEAADRHLQALNRRRDALQDRHNAVTALRQTQRDIQSLRVREDRLGREQEEASRGITAASAELMETGNALADARKTLETTMDVLRHQRLAREATAEELRKALEPDTPCPVCGSLEHPYHTDARLLEALDAVDRDEERRLRVAVERLDAAYVRAETRRENLESRLGAIAADLKALEHDRQALERQLAELPGADAVLTLPPEQRQPWCDQELKALRNDQARIADEVSMTLEWQAISRQLEQYRHALAALRQQQAARQEQHATAEAALARCQADLAGNSEKLQALLGSHPSARAWEDALEQARRTAAKAEESARLAREKAVDNCNRLDQALKLAEQQQQDAHKRLQTLDKAIAAWRAAHTGLDNPRLDHLLSLSDEDTSALRTRVERARNALDTIEATHRERDRQIQEHRKHQPTDEEIARLEERRNQVNADLEDASRSLRALQSRLLADDQAREKLRGLQARMDTQREQYERWARISDLVGSQDGRTFRRIAQAYNLDILVQHANAQLHNLARRYRLRRGGSDLGLLVIDTEMGDEIRSVHSLSGGETFLVSLALALGLASMASGTLQVESLFIDEGFGSLDPESLQLAMDALDGLQAQGRKVGVISHVQDMHERVPVQIRISPEGNGASRLEVR